MKKINVTPLEVKARNFPLRLMQLGFLCWRVIDDNEHDVVQYVEPPMVLIPAGAFLMGNDEEKDPETLDDDIPLHTVTLPEYRIEKYPLTVAEFRYFVQATQYPWPGSVNQQGLDHPVVSVSWEAIMTYTNWLSLYTGDRYRLPTEAE